MRRKNSCRYSSDWVLESDMAGIRRPTTPSADVCSVTFQANASANWYPPMGSRLVFLHPCKCPPVGGVGILPVELFPRGIARNHVEVPIRPGKFLAEEVPLQDMGAAQLREIEPGITFEVRRFYVIKQGQNEAQLCNPAGIAADPCRRSGSVSMARSSLGRSLPVRCRSRSICRR